MRGGTIRSDRPRAVRIDLAARGESLAAFDGRGIPASCVAPRSNTAGILGRRALLAGRLTRLGATPDFHHGLLAPGGDERLDDAPDAIERETEVLARVRVRD